MPVIETNNLTKIFAPLRGWRRVALGVPTAAVRQASLTVKQGEVFGLIGPNGAGKTTLVKMLCTLILPTSGTARVAGHALKATAAIRRAVGLVVADERSFYWRLSGRRNLRFFAAMHGLYGAEAERRIDEVLEAVGLRGHDGQRFSAYSTGMKQRLAIARALLHRPGLLFLDEPSRSLDPTGTRRLHAVIQQMVAERAVTVFLITHDLAEAEKLCQRVAVMHQGQIRVVGPPDTLRRTLGAQVRYKAWVGNWDGLVEEAARQVVPLLRVEEGQPGAGTGAGRTLISFSAGEGDGSLAALFDCLRRHQATLLSIEGHPPSLEEVFAHYTAGGMPASPPGQETEHE